MEHILIWSRTQDNLNNLLNDTNTCLMVQGQSVSLVFKKFHEQFDITSYAKCVLKF